MAGKKGQKKRFWSDDEKRSVCAQTTGRAAERNDIPQPIPRHEQNKIKLALFP